MIQFFCHHSHLSYDFDFLWHISSPTKASVILLSVFRGVSGYLYVIHLLEEEINGQGTLCIMKNAMPFCFSCTGNHCMDCFTLNKDWTIKANLAGDFLVVTRNIKVKSTCRHNMLMVRNRNVASDCMSTWSNNWVNLFLLVVMVGYVCWIEILLQLETAPRIWCRIWEYLL